MNKFILFFSILISSTEFSTGQSFSFIDDNVQYINPTCAGYDDFYVHMKNEKPDSLLLQWIGILNQLDPCWEGAYSICDNYNCYFGIPTSVSNMTKIGPGDTTFLKFSNAMMTQYSGNPIVKFLVWDMDLPSSIDTVTYHITICPDSTVCTSLTAIEVSELNNSSFKIFPVPAVNKLNLEFPVLSNGTISISDLSGKIIITVPAFGSSASLNIEWLTEGIYFITVSENTKTRITKKFIKL